MKATQSILMYLCVLITSIAAYSQADKQEPLGPQHPKGFGGCENGMEQAIKDVDKKTYRYYTYGLNHRTEEEWRFYKFYKTQMEVKYGILLIDGGVEVSTASQCYSKQMLKLIESKFGVNFLETKEKEAKEIFYAGR